MEYSMAVDATAASLEQEIGKAREALLRTSREDPGRLWSARELKAAAKNGESYGATGLALSQLIEDGTLVVAGDKIRLNG
jgi:hypothetical protein